MPKLSFVIGATASGKTYFINHHFADKEVEILNIYDYQQKEYVKAGFRKMIPLTRQAFECGWDYPPLMGIFGLLIPRKCGECGIKGTLWWKVQSPGELPIVMEAELSDAELKTWKRIKGEPDSLLNEASE